MINEDSEAQRGEKKQYGISLLRLCECFGIGLFVLILLLLLVIFAFKMNYFRIQNDFDFSLIRNLSCKCTNDSECGGLEKGTCWFGKCVCVNGWFGLKCDQNNCFQIINTTCNETLQCNYGVCYYGKCICPPGFYGKYCELKRLRLSYCHPDLVGTCGNGTCVLNENYNGECYCPITNLHCMSCRHGSSHVE